MAKKFPPEKSQFPLFGPKMVTSANFSKSSQRTFLIFLTETQFLVLTKMAEKKLSRKISISPFWPKNGPKIAIFPPKLSFWPISPNPVIGFFSYKLDFLFGNKMAKKKSPRKNINFPFWPQNGHLGQFLQIKSKGFL